MPEITITNTDWAIVDGVKTALSQAAVSQEPVFQAVGATTSDRQARDCQFTADPVAIIRYLTTRESASPEGVVSCRVELELTLAAKTSSPADDESVRLQAILRLVNAAKNAIAACPPSAASDWGGCGAAGFFSPAVEFGPCEIDTAERHRWAVARLPASFTFVLEIAASH